MARPRGLSQKAASRPASTACRWRGVRKPSRASRSSSPSIPAAVRSPSRGRYCMARWRAVPRWAGVRPRSSATKSGREMGCPRREGGAASSAASRSWARPFSWVAVSLEGRAAAARWGYSHPRTAASSSARSSRSGSGARSVKRPLSSSGWARGRPSTQRMSQAGPRFSVSTSGRPASSRRGAASGRVRAWRSTQAPTLCCCSSTTGERGTDSPSPSRPRASSPSGRARVRISFSRARVMAT